MLSFLAPAALAGVLLLAIPTAIHLFKPRKVRVTTFSSLRWLNMSRHKLARRIQWHQLLLYLLRAAFILLLILALARPLFMLGGSTTGVDRFIVLDVSRSMGYLDADQPTPLARAKEVASELLSHSRVSDRVTLILSSGRSHAMGPLVQDGQSYITRLSAIDTTQGRTDLSSALDTIAPMLPPEDPHRSAEIYYLTDDHLNSWNQGAIKQFTESAKRPVSVQLVDVSSPNSQNAYISEIKRLVIPGSPPHQALNVGIGFIGSETGHRKVQLDGIKGMGAQTKTITIEPGQTQWVQFDLPAGLDVHEQVARITLDPSDGLPTDDVAYTHLDNLAALRLLVITNTPNPNQDRNREIHLVTAIRALHQVKPDLFDYTIRTIDKLTLADIQQAQITVMANVPTLNIDQLEALNHRVRTGSGLAIFLGPNINPAFYNNGMYNPLNPAQGLIPWKLGILKQAVTIQGEFPSLSDTLWSHPLLQSLYDPILGDLPQTRFFQYFTMATETAPASQEPVASTPDQASATNSQDGNTFNSPPRVLARIDDQAPAIIENPQGAGKVLLFNTTADDTWSDLPRRKSFLPLVDHLITYLAGGHNTRNFEVLTPITLTLPQEAGKGPYTISLLDDKTPNKTMVDGPTYAVASQQIGSQSFIRLDSVPRPGVYTVVDSTGKTITSFIAHLGLDDSRITSIDTQILSQWWQPAAFTSSTPTDAVAKFVASTTTLRLWPWLIALGALCLLAEMYFVHYLCPRMNPKVVQSVIEHQKGIMQPLESASSRSTQPKTAITTE